MADSPTPAADITLARFECANCGSELMLINKPADQEPGPVTIKVPGGMLLSCRVCRKQMSDEMRLLAWPSASKSAN